MTNGAVEFLGLISFMLVGAGSFIAGYLSRYLLSDDYDAGYCQGYEDARRIQKQLSQLGKTE